MKRIIEINEIHFKLLEEMSDCGLGYYNEVILKSKPLQAELENIKAEIIKGKCKHCDIDVNIQKCLEEHNSLCDVDDILVIIDNRLKELNNDTD